MDVHPTLSQILAKYWLNETVGFLGQKLSSQLLPIFGKASVATNQKELTSQLVGCIS
jgi:hypothetical protein